MLHNIKNGRIQMGQSHMDYVCFGRGAKPLVFIPGLGDGLRTVKGMALPFAAMYRRYGAKHRVYVFSRKEPLGEKDSTRDMAAGLAVAMEALGLRHAYVMGVSQGGMIAQYLALDHPALVGKLVLAASAARPSLEMEEAVGGWLRMAREKDYARLLIDTAERSYSQGYLKRIRPMYPFLTRVGKPRDYRRFIIQANACLNHNAYEMLDRIACPALVSCGGSDCVVGKQAALEMAAKIPRSRLLIYQGLGHMIDQESKEFPKDVLDFLNEQITS